jgi:gluconokinase
MYKNLEEAAQKVKLVDGFYPQQQNHDIHRKQFAIFERLGTKLFDEFEAIADLQQNY